MSIKISAIYLCLFSFFGCAKIDSSLTKALTTSTNVRLEAIEKNKAIVNNDCGALIESDGNELADKAMNEFCSYKAYRIITKGSRVSGEKNLSSQWYLNVLIKDQITSSCKGCAKNRATPEQSVSTLTDDCLQVNA